MLDQLRQELRKLERPAGLEDAGLQPLGIAPIDGALGGGLARGALHEIAAASERHIAAAAGFALGISGVFPNRRTLIWIAEETALLESGAPCGPGLDEFTLAPERLIVVAVRRERDLCWAMEEALRCREVGTVIAETRRAGIESITLRRLSLAAAAHGALGILLRATPARGVSTATTRWTISAARSQPAHGAPGAPRMTAQLVRNRRGPLGSWTLEWSETDERFVIAPTHPQPVARPAPNRPARASAA